MTEFSWKATSISVKQALAWSSEDSPDQLPASEELREHGAGWDDVSNLAMFDAMTLHESSKANLYGDRRGEGDVKIFVVQRPEADGLHAKLMSGLKVHVIDAIR